MFSERSSHSDVVRDENEGPPSEKVASEALVDNPARRVDIQSTQDIIKQDNLRL